MVNKQKVLDIIKLDMPLDKENKEMILYLADKFLDDFNLKQSSRYRYEYDSFTIALVYLCCRKAKFPMSIKELQEICGNQTKPRTIHHYFRQIKDILGMKICPTASLTGNTCLVMVKPEIYLSKLNKLNLSEIIIEDTKKIINLFTKEGNNSGRSPQAIVGGAVYLAGKLNNQKIQQRIIADELGIVEVSVRNIYSKLKQMDEIKRLFKSKIKMYDKSVHDNFLKIGDRNE